MVLHRRAREGEADFGVERTGGLRRERDPLGRLRRFDGLSRSVGGCRAVGNRGRPRPRRRPGRWWAQLRRTPDERDDDQDSSHYLRIAVPAQTVTTPQDVLLRSPAVTAPKLAT